MRHDRDMIPVFTVEQVRAAESRAFAQLPDGELMARAVRGLFQICRDILLDDRGRLYGANVVILVGSGNNGADALWTGSHLAGRGVQVTAVAATDDIDAPAREALRAAGGRVESADISEDDFAALVERADIVLDGLLGIGGKGALRDPAAKWSQALLDSEALVIAVDLPSGVDPDSGVVADPSAVVYADQTVCLGTIKSGLIWGDGPDFAGEITLVDIGLLDYFDQTELANPPFQIVDLDDVAVYVAQPQRYDNKYTRGVVGVVSGSEAYPGAAVLSVGGALQGGVGMARYAGGAPETVIAAWPEVVVEHQVESDSKTNAWVVGSGGGVDSAALDRLERVLAAEVPVVLDADALTLLAGSDELRQTVADRHALGFATVLTPHDGEFARLADSIGESSEISETNGLARAELLKQVARKLGAVILLKGATTLVATPAGELFANDESSPALATAGSGDVLAGLLGSMLAHHEAQSGGVQEPGQKSATSQVEAARIAACAALWHGLAGIEADKNQGSVVATDILNELSILFRRHSVALEDFDQSENEAEYEAELDQDEEVY